VPRALESGSENVVSSSRDSGYFRARKTARWTATIVLPVPADPATLSEEDRIRLIHDKRTALLNRVFDELCEKTPGSSAKQVCEEIVLAARAIQNATASCVQIQQPARGLFVLALQQCRRLFSSGSADRGSLRVDAFDRALRLALKRSLPGPLDVWYRTRDKIRNDIFTNFWDEELQAFVQAKGTKDLDASAGEAGPCKHGTLVLFLRRRD
jgi:hypothetical protein